MEEQNKDIIPEGQIQSETPQEDQSVVENSIYTTPDVYQTQTAQDVYKTSDTEEDYQSMLGVFSGVQSGNAVEGENAPQADVNHYQYGNNQYVNNTDGTNQYQYGNNQYVNNTDGTNQYQYGNNQYVNNADGNQYQYGNNQYGSNAGGENQYGNNQFGNNAAGNQYQYGNNQAGNQYQYGNNQAGGNQYQYGNNQAGGNQYQYGNNQAGGNQYQYGNNQTGNQYQYGNQYGYNPNGYNPYSPYATPPKKKSNGVIIGVVIAIAVIFLIALLAIVYNGFKSISDRVSTTSDDYRMTSDLDDDDDADRSSTSGRDSHSRDDNDNDYKDDDDYNSDYDDDEYYELHDDIKDNLSYSIEWDYFEYELDDEDVAIYVDYPVIVGEDVPNLDKLNARIERQATSLRDYYEDEYSRYMDENGNSYFYVNSIGYVTYMSENILSIAFREETQANYFGAVYLYSINIDMNTGVIMENTDIIEVDDDFSVDFRKRSEKQNGVSDSLDSMSDQEITKLLKSEDNLIIFYTPQGMEIGVNYGDGYGWITVTYSDYKKYLKVF